MPQFNISGVRQSDGVKCEITIFADDEKCAIASVRKDGVFPIKVRETKQVHGSVSSRAFHAVENDESSQPNAPIANSESRLAKCSDCGGQVSKLAEVCPHCGCPLVSVEAKEARVKKLQPVMWLGVVCSILSMFLFPPILGLIGVICGFICLGRGCPGTGIVLIVCSCFSALYGMAMGAGILW